MVLDANGISGVTFLNGWKVGLFEGALVWGIDGALLGTRVTGAFDGLFVGGTDGAFEGAFDGIFVGGTDGIIVTGIFVGVTDGALLGALLFFLY